MSVRGDITTPISKDSVHSSLTRANGVVKSLSPGGGGVKAYRP